MAMPQRIVLSRRSGFDLAATSLALNGLPAKVVTRPGRWGNPFAIAEVMASEGLDRAAAQARAVALCSNWLRGTLSPELSAPPPPDHDSIRNSLGGHNLACWCKAGTPCHADILIDIANSN